MVSKLRKLKPVKLLPMIDRDPHPSQSFKPSTRFMAGKNLHWNSSGVEMEFFAELFSKINFVYRKKFLRSNMSNSKENKQYTKNYMSHRLNANPGDLGGVGWETKPRYCTDKHTLYRVSTSSSSPSPSQPPAPYFGEFNFQIVLQDVCNMGQATLQSMLAKMSVCSCDIMGWSECLSSSSSASSISCLLVQRALQHICFVQTSSKYR